jgi:hypothetical protein
MNRIAKLGLLACLALGVIVVERQGTGQTPPTRSELMRSKLEASQDALVEIRRAASLRRDSPMALLLLSIGEAHAGESDNARRSLEMARQGIDQLDKKLLKGRIELDWIERLGLQLLLREAEQWVKCHELPNGVFAN